MVEAIYHSFKEGSLPQASKTSQDVESRDTRNKEDDQICFYYCIDLYLPLNSIIYSLNLMQHELRLPR